MAPAVCGWLSSSTGPGPGVAPGRVRRILRLATKSGFILTLLAAAAGGASAETGDPLLQPVRPIGLTALAEGLLEPDLSSLVTALPLLFETVAVAVLAAVLSAAIACLTLPLLVQPRMPELLATSLRAALILIGAIPWLAVAALLVLALGPGYQAALVAITVSGVPGLTLRLAAAVKAADPALGRTLANAGAVGLQRLRFALWPQVGPDVTAALWDCLNRALSRSVIAGLVGAGGLGVPLFDAIRNGRLNEASALLLLIALSAIGLNLLIASARQRR